MISRLRRPATLPVVADDDALDYDEARGKGHADALEAAAERAPDHALLRVAWAHGFGQVDQLRGAVQEARAQGFTWRDIGQATGENWRTAQTKYGGGYEGQRRYRERKRQAGE